MSDWLSIINNENADDGDRIILPPPITVDLNVNGTIQKEISYRMDENNPDSIIRTETIFEIVNIKKKVSKAAIQRRQHWQKFGQCKNVPKGTPERGVTNQREGNFPFLWNGKNMQNRTKTDTQPKKLNFVRPELKEEPKIELKEEPKSGKYVPMHMRNRANRAEIYGKSYSSVFDEDDKVEIKISNLPQWSEFMNVKHLIDEFYKKHLHQRYIPKYRIRMIPSKRTLEEWHSDPKMYAHRLAEYERLAIVEFENEKSAQKAIKLLDGHHYDSHILRVEKAKPRNR